MNDQYLYIGEGDLHVSTKAPDDDDKATVEQGELQIIRFRVYSPEAAQVAGLPGVFEQMEVEAEEQEGEEILDGDGEPTGDFEDGETVYNITWTSV